MRYPDDFIFKFYLLQTVKYTFLTHSSINYSESVLPMAAFSAITLDRMFQ